MTGKVKFDQEAAFKLIIGSEKEEPTKEPTKEPTTEKPAAGNVKLKAGRETKKRVSLALYPSTYSDLQKIAYVKRQSVSDVVTELIGQYVATNVAKLKEYNKIKSE